MTQPPPASGGQPSGGQPGHPEPDPAPEPEPPQPIPPPDPIPHPEPPHADQPEPPQAEQPEPPQAERAEPPQAGNQPTVVQAAAASTADFIDAPPPAADAAWPPVGAYPGEPGHAPAGAEATTVWQQPPPSGPWHARHEKPGEWQHHPPEHLAFEHSPPAEVRDPTRPAPHPQAGRTPATDAEATMRRRRTGLWASVALTVTLLLCAGGGASAYLLFRNSDAGGAPDPATAVNRFMTAVYTQQDPAAADDLVCREARDGDALATRIEEIRGYANEYDAPAFRWTEPAVAGQSEERATVSVDLTMSTDDEKAAQQRLTFTTVRKTNWLVCEISG